MNSAAPSTQKQGLETDKEPSHKILYRSEKLLQGRRQIIIEHGEIQYRLSVTKAGKLILNK